MFAASVLIVQSVSVYVYSREDLLNIRASSGCKDGPSLLFDPAKLSGGNSVRGTGKSPPLVHAVVGHSPRRRGRRSGALVRFRRRAHRPPLPAIVLSNVRSLNNKTDELFHLLNFKRELRDSSVLCFTETWLKPDMPNAAVTPPGFTVCRLDRVAELSGKREGGGVCFMINNRWCSDFSVVSQSCSPVLEHLAINCRPYYSPREFS